MPGGELEKVVYLLVGLVVVGCFVSVNWASVLSNGAVGSDIVVETPGSEKLLDGEFVDLFLNVSSVNWGALSPGGSSERGLKVLNDGNVPMDLSLRCELWVPLEAAEWISVGWSYAGEILEPGKELDVVLMLSVSRDVPESVTNWSCQIVISGVKAAK